MKLRDPFAGCSPAPSSALCVDSRPRRQFAAASLSAALALLGHVGDARADAPEPAGDAKPVSTVAPERPTESTPKRALPDYDGRGQAPDPPGEIALWLPRAVLYPLYFVSEYVLRRPIGAFLSHAERHHWAEALLSTFTWNDRKIGVVPTFLADFGFLPSVGVYFFWDDFLAKNNDLRVSAGTWGVDWLALTVTDRIHIVKGRSRVELRSTFVRRSDYRIYPLGPDSPDVLARFGADLLDAGPTFLTGGWRSSTFSASVGVRRWVLRQDLTCCGSPDIDTQVAAGAFPPPSDSDYTVLYSRLDGAIDSRLARPDPGSGFLLHAIGEQASGVAAGQRRSWLNWGGDIGASVDVTGIQRVLSLTASARFTEAVQGSVPFVELSTLGGNELMRGFYPGRLRDRSAAALTLQYTWPIWVFLDGAMHFAVGNVFGEHLAGIAPEKLRWSSGVGIRTNGSRDHTVEALFAAGSETFEQGGRIQSFRLMLGSHHGF